MKPRIVAGAEPFAFDGGPVGVLLIHGFTGNPASMRPMGEWLSGQGCTAAAPRLPGHGTHWRDLAGTSWHDWAGEAERGLETLAERCSGVVACGLSVGGSLALHLGATRPDLLQGVVAINPYIEDRRHTWVPLARLVLRTTKGVGNDIKKRGADELPYPRIPLSAVSQLARFLKTVREELPSMRLPLLLFHSPEDHVVPAGNADHVMDHVGTEDKEKVLLNDSYHVATLDNEAETVFKRTLEFARAHVPG